MCAGINDSIALRVADIGVAMGRVGTDVAKEAADVVLLDDDLRTLLPAIEEGKGIFSNIRNFVRFQLSTSVAALLLVAICTTLQLQQPLNAMQILWINLIMDGPPAQSLGVEPVDPEVLRQPPRLPSEPIITWLLLRRIVGTALTVVLGTMHVLLAELAAGAPVRHITTMTFTTFVMFDMFNALSCRSMDRSVASLALGGNAIFLWAIGGSIAGQLAVIYVPPLQAVFQTAPLSGGDWFTILSTAVTVLLVDEAMKAVDRGDAAGCAAALLGSSRRSRVQLARNFRPFTAPALQTL